MLNMKLHERHQQDDFEIKRVPGGWIYRFTQYNHVPTVDGSWAHLYTYDSVFVPLNDEFK